MARLVLHQPDARSAARLRSALAGAHELTTEPVWPAFRRAVADLGVEGCLLDADHPTPDEAAENVRALQSSHRELAVVGFTDRRSALQYFHLGALGFDGVVSTDNGPMTTRVAVDAALALARGRRVRRRLQPVLADPGPELMGWAVAHAGPGATVERFAESAGITPRTLREELRARDLVSPSDLLLLGRLLTAGWRLSRDGRRVEETSYVLGYSGGPSLGRALRRTIGVTLQEASAPDGLERVAEVVLERLGLDAATTHALARDLGTRSS